MYDKIHYKKNNNNKVTQMVKNQPAMEETQVWSLGQEALL